jgi:dienelactone hydrolase
MRDDRAGIRVCDLTCRGEPMNLRLVIALCAAMIVATPTPAATPAGDFATRAALFRYDMKADLALEETGVAQRDGVAIHDLSFVAMPGTQQRTKAYLVVPAGKGPFAGILWTHWLGEPATSNRTQYLDEAVALASQGVVSLLIDAMWSNPDWYAKRDPDQDFAHSIQQTIALRRAMDLLAQQPNVDGKRLGYVGHDFGGMYGTLMAGVDRRAKTYVFIAVAPSLLEWAFFAPQPKSKIDYIRENAPLELSDFVRRIDNASVLFQFAKNDAYISRASTGVLFNAANAPKERKFYDADHAMNKPEITADRDAWLLKELVSAAAAK